MASVTLNAPVKINLHLGIHPGRDMRGYHRADSVMIALGVGDRVTVSETTPDEAASAPDQDSSRTGVLLDMSEDVGVAPARNTAWLAASRLKEALGIPTPVRVTVRKRVPPQSGLGGSSSDAASVLLALCRLFGTHETTDDARRDERVVSVARSVGADVPFFLTLAPAYLTGAGDVLAEEFPELDGLPIALVRPAAGVSTAEAYRALDADPTEPASPDRMLAALRSGDASGVAGALYNNLEPAALSIVPQVGEVKSWLAAQPGVEACMVTGSGSCVFAICDTPSAADAVASAAHYAKDWWSCSTTSVGKSAQVC